MAFSSTSVFYLCLHVNIWCFLFNFNIIPNLVKKVTTTWYWLRWREIFTQQALESRGSWEECLKFFQAVEAGKASVSKISLAQPINSFWTKTLQDLTCTLITIIFYIFFYFILFFLLVPHVLLRHSWWSFPVISERLLMPQIVTVKGKVHFIDAFCGSYFTFAVSKEGHVYGFGLNNYHQLG